MAAVGQLGGYAWGQYWNEEPELFVPDVIRDIAPSLVGLRAVNVAFNSGLLGHRIPLPDGWSRIDDHAVSPVCDINLLNSWPRSEDSFDEWYFFREVPKYLQITPFCNWYTFPIDQWEILRRTENGFDLCAQLEHFEPEAVIGSGHSIFVISQNRRLVNQFLALAHEPELER